MAAMAATAGLQPIIMVATAARPGSADRRSEARSTAKVHISWSTNPHSPAMWRLVETAALVAKRVRGIGEVVLLATVPGAERLLAEDFIVFPPTRITS